MPTLTGTEVLYVQGQDAQGRPAATLLECTTDDIANLAGALPAPLPVTAASTAANLTNYGITTISSTAAKAYTIDAPSTGNPAKYIIVTGGTTTDAKTVRISTANGAATFDGTNNTATFISTNNALSFVGISTARYGIFGNIGSVALSNT